MKILALIGLVLVWSITCAIAQTGGCGAICQPVPGAALYSFNFLLGALPPEMSLTRNSPGWYYDSSGNLQQAVANVPRFDHNPSSLAAEGILVEQASTNSIRNDTLAGLTTGSPGTMPTNWSTVLDSGFTRTIATGTENNMPYIDLNISGTSAAAGTSTVLFETSTGVPFSANYELQAVSAFVKVSGGTTSNITSTKLEYLALSTTGSVVQTSQSSALTFTSSALSMDRQSLLVNGSATGTAYAQAGLVLSYNLGAAVNITYRIAVPQLELNYGALITSPIVTSGSAVTRQADVLTTQTGNFVSSAGGAFTVGALQMVADGFSFSPFIISDGTSNNQIFVNGGITDGASCGVVIGGTTTSSSQGAVLGTSPYGFGVSYKPSSNFCSFNGSTVAAGSFGTASNPVGLNKLSFNSAGQTWFQSFSYWPYPLTQAQLNANTP